MGLIEGSTNATQTSAPGEMPPRTDAPSDKRPLFDVGLAETTFKSISEVLRAFAFHWHVKYKL